MENSPFEVPVQDVLSDGYLNPDDAILPVPQLFLSSESPDSAPAPDPKNFADLLPLLDLDGNKLLNKAELKASVYNESLSQMQRNMVDLLSTRYDIVRMLGPTDLPLNNNAELSPGDLDELNNVANDKYGAKNILSTTVQNAGELPHGILFSSVVQVGLGLAWRNPRVIGAGLVGIGLAAGIGSVDTIMNSAETRGMENEVKPLLSSQ
jgi:hypothetical protein